MPFFTQRPMDDWKQWALCWSVPSSLKFHFPCKKNSFHGSNLQRMNLNTFLTLEPSQYSKECITFSWSKLVATHSNCSRIETPLFLLGTACPSNQPKQCWALHQEQGHWFWSQNHLWFASGMAFCRVIAWQPGRGCKPETWTQTWTLQLTKRCKCFSAPKSLNKLFRVWNLFWSVEDAEIEKAN